MFEWDPFDTENILSSGFITNSRQNIIALLIYKFTLYAQESSTFNKKIQQVYIIIITSHLATSFLNSHTLKSMLYTFYNYLIHFNVYWERFSKMLKINVWNVLKQLIFPPRLYCTCRQNNQYFFHNKRKKHNHLEYTASQYCTYMYRIFFYFDV